MVIKSSLPRSCSLQTVQDNSEEDVSGPSFLLILTQTSSTLSRFLALLLDEMSLVGQLAQYLQSNLLMWSPLLRDHLS